MILTRFLFIIVFNFYKQQNNTIMNDNTLTHKFQQLLSELNRHIIGQPHLTERMVMGLLADGHLLIK